jgi:hypothetical protein
MNKEILMVSLKGVNPRKIERYCDYMNYYSRKPEPETPEDLNAEFESVLRILQNGK